MWLCWMCEGGFGYSGSGGLVGVCYVHLCLSLYDNYVFCKRP